MPSLNLVKASSALSRERDRIGRASQPNLAVQMASRLGRDTFYYTAVGSAGFPIAFVNAIVLTRYLSPTEYGQLAVLFFISGLTSVVLNLLFLRGTERQVWGAADELVDVDDPDLPTYEDKLRTLSSGVMLTAVGCVITIIATILFAPWLSEHLVHSKHLQAAVVWAGVSGGLGSVWRIVVNTCRWERHRAGFGITYTVRPVLAFALSWPLVAAGKGVAGAMAAVAIATFGSIIVGLFYARHSLRFTLSVSAARRIGRSSGNYAAMVIGLYVLHSGDTYFLSRFGVVADVGVYKLATNIASFISYAVSGFLMAWGPLERSSLFAASYDRFGHPRMRAEFMQYYLITGIFLVLALVAIANPVIAMFAPSFHPAEKFIPITSLGYLAYGLVLVVARGSTFPRRFVVYGIAAMTGAVALGVTSWVLAPKIGGYGVAIGDIVGGVAATAVILIIAALWGHLPSVDKRRLTTLILIGGGCFTLSTVLAPRTGGTGEAMIKIVSAVAFLGLAFLCGTIPASHRRTLWQTLWSSIRPRTWSPAVIAGAVALPRTDRRIVTAIVRDREPVSRVSALTGLPAESVRVRLVAALRQVAQVDAPAEKDPGIAEYLLDFESVTAQDRCARELWEEGVSPGALLEIDWTFHALRSAPAKAWSAAEEQLDDRRVNGSRTIDPAAIALLEKVVRHGESGNGAASGLEQHELDRGLVRALRAFAGDGAPHPADPLIGAFLIGGPHAPPASQLWAAGVDPIELHKLELLLVRVRELPSRKWQRMRTPAEAS